MSDLPTITLIFRCIGPSMSVPPILARPGHAAPEK
jgi:hypothetical protein